MLGKCHNDCRNRGLCISMADLAMYHGKDYDPTSLSAGDGYGPVYSNWEANSLLTCQCDFGFFGPDCSLGQCSAVYAVFRASLMKLCIMLIG